jgi:tetratricopeptide (TPR) repeat protein
MNIRTKTKRRLMILVAAVAVSALGLGGAWVWHVHNVKADTAANRAAGMAAAKAGNYTTAVESFAKYYRRSPDDTEALLEFAKARMKVELPQGGHIAGAMALFRHLLDIEPSNREAQVELLKLYVMVGYSKETGELADRILKDDPKNVEALRSKAISLAGLRKFDEAYKFAQKAAAADPANIQSHWLVLQLMQKLDKPGPDITAYVTGLLKQHPDDPRYETLMGMAEALARNNAKATEWLKKAATRPLTEPRDIQMLVTAMDGVNLFNDALAVLDAGAQKTGDPDLARLVILRLWQQNRDKEVLEHLSKLTIDTPDKFLPDLIAFKAMSLVRTDKKDEATAQIVILETRSKTNNRARAWAPFLRLVVLGDGKDAKKIIETCKQSLSAAPDNAVVHYFLGEAYAQVGENELAIEQWGAAVKIANAWATPLARIAQVLTATGRAKNALPLAHMALLRAPNNLNVVVSLVNAWADAAATGALADAPDANKDLLKLVTEVQKGAPGEPRTLPVYVDLLAAKGDKDQAVAAIKTAIANAKQPLPEQTLSRLFAISKKHGLGIEDSLIELSEKAHGVTPQLAFNRAYDLAVAGNADAATEYLHKVIESKKAENDLDWKLAWARLLDVVKDGRAKDVWVALADTEKGNLAVQRMALEAAAVQRDRAFLDRTIDRVKALSAEDGVTWRVARARWLLNSDNVERDAARASVMLTDIVQKSPDLLEPHILLAAAQEKLNNNPAAVEQLVMATNISADNPNLLLELARLRVVSGDTENGRAALNRAMKLIGSNLALRRQAASIQLLMGDTDSAVALLADEKQEPSLLLAELYLRRNEPAKAEVVYKQLLSKPDPGPQTLRSYAFFLGSMGRNDDAIAALAKLKTMSPEPGSVELAYAEFYRRFVGADQAIEQYRASIKLAKDSRAAAKALVGYLFELKRFDEAFAAAEDAYKANPDAKTIATIVVNKELLRRSAAAPQLMPLIMTMIRDQDLRDTALEVLRVIDDAQTNRDTISQLLVKMRATADKYPNFLALQLLLGDFYLTAGQRDAAVEIGTRTMRTFPSEPAPAEQVTRVLQAEGKLKEALPIARQWRDRSLSNPLSADMAIADLEFVTGDVAGAAKQIEPYLNMALANPGRFFPVISLHTRILCINGKDDQAASLLKPLLEQNRDWRLFWMGLALRIIKDPATSAAWLERVQPNIPADSVVEVATLAADWYALGQRNDNANYRKKGVDLLKKVTADDKADPDLIVSYGQLLYQEKDIDGAAAQYRRAMRLRPEMSIAMNNLAMLLTDNKGDINEGLTLAQKAVELQPSVATFWDTLAYIQSKLKQHEQAIASLRKAMELEPTSLDWKISLARVFVAAGKRDDAERAIREIETSVPDMKQVPKAQRDALQKVRTSLTDKSAAVPTP